MSKENGRKNKESFLQGILILMMSQVIIKILGLIQTLYLTNRNGFGDNGNAIYMGGYQIYALLLSVSSIGIPTAISKLISEKLAINDEYFAKKIFRVAIVTFAFIGMCGTLLLLVSAEFISKCWLEIPESKTSLMILAPGIFFVSVSSVLRGYFNGKQQMKATANSQSIEQFLKTIFMIVFVEIAAIYTLNNTNYMVAMATVGTTLSIMMSFGYLYKYYLSDKKEEKILKENSKIKNISSLEIVKMILFLSIPISLTAILTSVIKIVDSVTVVRILKPILGEDIAKIKYGILSAKADILVTLPLSLNVAFTTAIVPAISSSNAKGDYETIKKKITLSLLLCLIIGLPCMAGMFVYSKEILILLFPYAPEGSTLLAISSITIVFAIISQTINGILQGYGDVKIPVYALILGLVSKIIANLILLPVSGVYENGAAIGTVICHVVSFIVVYVALKRRINFKFSLFRLSIRPVMATIIMIVSSLLLYNWILNLVNLKIAIVVSITFAVIIFGICVLIFKIFTREEIEALPAGSKVLKALKKMKIYT